MGYDQYIERVSEAAVGLQPICVENKFSRGKSFGKVLAYLAGQVAVVATDAVDHPLFFTDKTIGILSENAVESWATNIVSILRNPEVRAQIARKARQKFDCTMTTAYFAELLDPILRHAARLPLTERQELTLRRTRLASLPALDCSYFESSDDGRS
jgi:hypothetical protein